MRERERERERGGERERERERERQATCTCPFAPMVPDSRSGLRLVTQRPSTYLLASTLSRAFTTKSWL